MKPSSVVVTASSHDPQGGKIVWAAVVRCPYHGQSNDWTSSTRDAGGEEHARHLLRDNDVKMDTLRTILSLSFYKRKLYAHYFVEDNLYPQALSYCTVMYVQQRQLFRVLNTGTVL